MKYQIVAIEREYATGGREIGKTIAEKMQIPCYGGEVLQMAAKQIGIDPENVEHMDEKAPNSLLYSLAAMARPITFGNGALPQENILQQKEAETIYRLAEQGRCVFVGHRAGAVLRKRQDVLRVFIHADMDFRLQRAINCYQIPPDHAESVLKRCDRQRADYYRFYTTQNWNDVEMYPLVLDSGKLGLERCANIILAALE